jgi:hypothetical protein
VAVVVSSREIPAWGLPVWIALRLEDAGEATCQPRRGGRTMTHQGEITRLLAELSHGGRDALDQLLPLVYQELQRIAHRRLDVERAARSCSTNRFWLRIQWRSATSRSADFASSFMVSASSADQSWG